MWPILLGSVALSLIAYVAMRPRDDEPATEPDDEMEDEPDEPEDDEPDAPEDDDPEDIDDGYDDADVYYDVDAAKAVKRRARVPKVKA